MYITKQLEIPTEVYELLDQLGEKEAVAVSGLPIIKWGIDQKDTFYNDNSEVVDMPFVPRFVIRHTLSAIGAPHISESFLGTYPILVGENPETGDDYQFGIRDELNFSLKALRDSV